MDLPEGLLEPGTRERLRRALAGSDEARRLHVHELAPGDTGILELAVRQVQSVRTYARRKGGEGLLGRVTLSDTTGEVDLVLWDDETRKLQDGTFRPGARIRLRGATVRAGHRGGVELGLGSAVLEELAAAPPLESQERTLRGILGVVGPTRVVGNPPRERFQADVQVDTPEGPANLVAEGELVKALRQILPGAPLRIDGVAPHPALDGWWLAGPGIRLSRDP